ncbi:hypothetical protein Nepgr_015602 [Nepenthes gracilis]|uniref:Conserved oligomeric Golgi complex subunit 3 n=2 Tax=Magnoliopsida TaxID=3398 RepID=A0AAD3SNU0_NEPGR|nr:hypothetical protein Nepgr_015602 [Nepenthes gracilis]
MAAARISTPSVRKSGAISKSYNFASAWEQNAPLTEQQQAAIAALSHAVAERPFPPNLALQEGKIGQESALSTITMDIASEDSAAIEAVLVNTNQFYKWFTDLEAAMKSETEEKYRHYVDTLTQHIQTCDGILHQVDDTLELFNELQLQHQAVATKTKTLHDACDRLLIEKERLIEFADALRSRLNYFDELENIATSFYSPSMNLGNENFLPLLKRLDECISYVESNPQYAESSVYLVKFRQLQSRALSMIRSHVHSVLRSASSQVQGAMRSSAGNQVALSEGVEASVIYVRFKAAASELKIVFEEIESRFSRKEYSQLLEECHRFYCEQRLSLVRGIVQQRISYFAKKEALPSLTRSGCAYLMQECQLEHQLFSHFFPSSSKDVSSLAPLIEPLCTYLYDTLRPKLIHETNLDFLGELVDVLKVEVLGEQLSRRSESLTGLRPTFERILADVRERLTFRARTYIRDEIANYFPLHEDLDYPSKLEQSPKVKEGADTADESRDMFHTWYPPLEKTVSLLSKLYHCLEPAVFTGLAQEAVEVCSVAIQKASRIISQRSSPMDGQLFLIKHLLLLREQIAPFDIEFSVTHKELDFSHVLEHLRRILRGQASLFDWSRSTSLARTLSPRVLESQIDAKKELEKSLKATCEEFIMSVTKLIVDPLLSFVAKVTAVKVPISSSVQNQKAESVVAKPLKEHAFASPEKVAELVQKVIAALQQELPQVIEKMKLYLQNPLTRTILFKPIKTNILEAYTQVQSLVKTEYSEEDRETIVKKKVQDLSRYRKCPCSFSLYTLPPTSRRKDLWQRTGSSSSAPSTFSRVQLLIWGEISRAVISSAAKMKKSPLPVHNICGTEKKIWGKEDLVKILRWHFGHSEFRGKQLEAIEAVLSGRDCFCLMPTGGGKSMCYQIPALAKKGIVLIVCPLIALMENQVMALKEKGIAAEFLSSTQTPHARNKIYEDLESGRPTLKLLYVTPELVATPGFSLKLSKIYDRGLLHLIAIDEAHCISTWGHDFRPSYRKLSSLRNCLPDVPILALTATAVPRVQRDVVESLSLQNPLILKSSFNRPNIYYEVRYKDLLRDPYDDLCIAIKSCGDVCAIVYCLERTTCDALAAHLSDNGLSCAAYHAGLNNKLRSSILDDWISLKIQIVVATVAFGN